MMINASHRAATVRPLHAVLLIPSSATNNFSYNSDRAAQRRCTSLLIPDIAVTHSGLLAGTISVYKPALLPIEEGIVFDSKRVSHFRLFVFCVICSHSRVHRPVFASLRLQPSRDSSFILMVMTPAPSQIA